VLLMTLRITPPAHRRGNGLMWRMDTKISALRCHLFNLFQNNFDNKTE